MMEEFNLSPLLPSTGIQAQEISKATHDMLRSIYKRSLSSLRTESTNKSSTKGQYAGRFQRALFTADAVVWFQEKGQYMHPTAQQLFVELLQEFQSDPDSEARYTQVRINEIMKKEKFFTELFFDTASFERGKFTYECLAWFKTTGQYLSADVQDVFVGWLRAYQQSHSNDGDFIKARLQWMLKNNDLYRDFLELGI